LAFILQRIVVNNDTKGEQMKKTYTHSELIEQYRSGLITFEEFLKLTGYTSFLRPVN